jgi:hypothetical protein
MPRPIVAALGAAILLAAASTSPAWTLRVTCRDGATHAFLSSNGHHRKLPVCDLDGAVDGVCTFYSDMIVLKCRTTGGAGCQDISDASERPPCPFDSTTAVPLRSAGKPATVKQVEIPDNKRFPPERLILRCLPSVASVTTTTTTTLPGTLNFTGDWTLATSETVRGCPSDINNPTLSPRELLIMQTGTALSGCASNFLHLSGTASNGSFFFQPAGDFDASGETNNWGVTFFGSRADTGAIQVTERWRAASGLTPGCENLWESTLAPRVGPACASHADCIRMNNPCSRCIDGECRERPPFCRSLSFQSLQ